MRLEQWDKTSKVTFDKRILAELVRSEARVANAVPPVSRDRTRPDGVEDSASLDSRVTPGAQASLCPPSVDADRACGGCGLRASAAHSGGDLCRRSKARASGKRRD